MSLGPPDDAPPSSQRLLARAREGDRSAIERLFERHLTSLRRWARGRLPRGVRAGAADTDDLVQEAAFNVFRRLEHFEPRRRQALRAYLRQAVRNRVRDALRHAKRHPPGLELDEGAPGDGPSPLDAAIGAENAARYRAALARLRDDDRELVVARLELGYSYEQIALAGGRPSVDAVRVALRRALLRLAQEMEA